ncbi:MAG: efflux RND transporter periplasmic adaptor subunit [Pseudomonadota bacterium]
MLAKPISSPARAGAAAIAVSLLAPPAMAQEPNQAVTTGEPAPGMMADEPSDGFGVLFRDILGFLGIAPAGGPVDATDHGPHSAPEPARDAADIVRAVALIRPSAEQTVLQRNFFGRVVARETADLAFPLDGTLRRFPAEEGSIVGAGSVLAELDLSPFERAVERAEIQLEQAERVFQRAAQLAARGVGATTSAEDAESARDLADVALREARDALADATITAPYRALIAERLTANHVIVEPGLPIVRVHDISEMRVEIDIPERLVQRVPVASDVIFSALLPGQTTPSILQVVEFEAETEALGQSYTFALALPNASPAALLPGSSLTVTAVVPKSVSSLVLPTTAIAADAQRQPYVMVFEPTGADLGVVRARAVEVSSIDGTSFAVTGLLADVEVVETGAHLLRDGQNVRRFTRLRVEE